MSRCTSCKRDIDDQREVRYTLAGMPHLVFCSIACVAQCNVEVPR